MKLFLISSFVFLSGLTSEARWNLNDVSFLLPLPQTTDSDGLLNIHAPGLGGTLLPKIFLGTIPPLTPVLTEDQGAESLRVVAVRIDPCFPLPTPLACQRQIRLVWQPLEPRPNHSVQSMDAALHSFYVLEEAEFTALLKDLLSWKARYQVQTDGRPLQVHPAWAQHGVNSPALREFQKIVLKFAGFGNLSRVTAMVVRGEGNMWVFAGFEVRNRQLQLFKVPRIPRFSQAFMNFAVPADHFERGLISPLPGGEDHFEKVIANSDIVRSGSKEILESELRALHRIENPQIFNPENMDCVSCHVAQTARIWLENNRSDLRTAELWQEHAYKNARHDLRNLSPHLKNTHIIRAFGYFENDIAISQRVIYESAEVADRLNEMGPL